MSRYFKFNDRDETLIKTDDIYEVYASRYISLTQVIIILIRENEEIKKALCYANQETISKDINRLCRFLNKKEVLK